MIRPNRGGGTEGERQRERERERETEREGGEPKNTRAKRK